MFSPILYKIQAINLTIYILYLRIKSLDVMGILNTVLYLSKCKKRGHKLSRDHIHSCWPLYYFVFYGLIQSVDNYLSTCQGHRVSTMVRPLSHNHRTWKTSSNTVLEVPSNFVYVCIYMYMTVWVHMCQSVVEATRQTQSPVFRHYHCCLMRKSLSVA